MTTGFNIFEDKTGMPSAEMNEVGSPVRTRQAARDGKNALALTSQTEQADVANCCRPRRGHDY